MALHFTLSLVASLDRALGQGESAPSVVLIDIKGAIGFVAAGQLAKAAEKGAALGSPAVIVRIDTPGGLLSSTREMIHAILASPVPVVMYVAPNGSRAASAGTYLMYAVARGRHGAEHAPGRCHADLALAGRPAGSPPPSPPPGARSKQPDTRSDGSRPRARASTTRSPTSARSPSCAAATPTGPRRPCAMPPRSLRPRRSRSASST